MLEGQERMVGENGQSSSAPPSLRDVVRCVQPVGETACHGRLDFSDTRAVCHSCGRSYQVHLGVPILRRDLDQNASVWFDDMYNGRTRQKDVDSGYLRDMRERVGTLAVEFKLAGPSLDIGCGTGLFADLVPQYIGLEYAPAALFVQGFEGYARLSGDARELPLADASVELVISFNVIEHVDDVQKVYCEIDRVLRPGGMIIMKPAWHCQKLATELIPIRRYSQLNFRQKLTKFFLPVIRSRPYKLMTWLPWRAWRRMTARPENPLKWQRFTPYYGQEWIADADACSGIDIHETILFFESRGYTSQSHASLRRKLMAGHDLLIMTKGQPKTSLPAAEAAPA